jgi:GntR family transcriptional regulator
VRPIAEHAYTRIADHLRREILDGTLPPGAELPSIRQLKEQFHASDHTVVEAMKVLLNEGLVESKPGTLTRVRARPQTIRMVRSWHQDMPSGSPWRAMMAAVGRTGDWQSHSTPVSAPPVVAERLGLEADARVMQTTYTFTADGEPAYLSTSWEPMALTLGSPILLPESGPYAGLGVVDRMALIDQVVTRETHEISPHTLTEPEATKLRLRAGSAAVLKVRTYWAGELAVETAQIVLPAHVVTRYEIPVGPAAAAE